MRVLEGCPALPAAIVHPVLARLHPDALAQARRQMEHQRFAWTANAEARARFAAPYLRNTLTNAPAIGRESDVSALDGAARGRPVFVVAAGPSLDRNLAALARVRDRGVLVSVDTALAPLMHYGITPDIVISVDPSALNARHLRSVQVSPRTWLVAEGSLDPGALPAFAGRTFFYRVAQHHPWPWLMAHGIDRGVLQARGSVLVTAIDLADRRVHGRGAGGSARVLQCGDHGSRSRNAPPAPTA